MVKIPAVSIPIRNRDPNLRDVMIEILLCNAFMVKFLINVITEEDHHFFFRERSATIGNELYGSSKIHKKSFCL